MYKIYTVQKLIVLILLYYGSIPQVLMVLETQNNDIKCHISMCEIVKCDNSTRKLKYTQTKPIVVHTSNSTILLQANIKLLSRYKYTRNTTTWV